MASSRFTPAERMLLLKGILILSEHADKAGQIFYQYLFEIDPDVKDLFANTNVEAQHKSYGISAEHYLPFGEALLMTLAEIFEEDFTASMESVWMKMYTLVVITIRSAE